MATITFNETIVFKTQSCISCGVHFALPQSVDDEFKRTHKTFYCPNGHSQFYSADNEAEKLRKELKRKEQELADEAIKKLKIQNELDKSNRQLKGLKNGVCPCCNRSFHNLQQHIKKQHPQILNHE